MQAPSAIAFDVGPSRDCAACPRLVEYRDANRAAFPDWSNAPVPSFGKASARLLIVGLAPGLRGANRTGRPFTGDYAGDLLYQTLLRYGFASGVYDRRPDDGLELVDCAIVNAVRCAPPQNKPTPQEIRTCRAYLTQSIGALPRLRAVLALGRVAHETVLRAFGARSAELPFAHGARQALKPAGVMLFDSYHCSRYNTNTGVLTDTMFQSVFAAIRAELDCS
ncbi:MAG: uracil-DNA glycosylase [Roseiarcus sp.]|uniref:uracil-DNA glycosylase n=1 Tax=Roseiarcus sp. TaxID=1969460 RepID=UPI003C48DC88